jgi:2-keto-4-pentenoate hydratase/2-oxohepta-3-ene-1,7-dioic acid hydratase in catechol pathway
LFTGTPAGVGPVQIGDQLRAELNGQTLLELAIK